MRKSHSGFSLIELMTAVVIIGILGAIAIPAYTEHLRKVRRSDAMSALTACANTLERYYTLNYTYVGGACDSATTDFYTLTFSVPTTTTTYTLRATPIAATSQNGDGFLELTSAGAERWDEDDNGAIDTDPGPPPFDNNNWESE